jgi:hypothetical protein
MTNVDWDTLIPEMKAWNSGKGIDPASWVGCEGNFKLACAYTLIFWPQFTEQDGMIFGGEVDSETISSWMKNCGGNKQSVEATLNHIHILDLHYRGCPDASVERLVHLGNTLRDIYATKLKAEFPDRNFIVEFYEPPDKNLNDYQLVYYQAP